MMLDGRMFDADEPPRPAAFDQFKNPRMIGELGYPRCLNSIVAKNSAAETELQSKLEHHAAEIRELRTMYMESRQESSQIKDKGNIISVAIE